MRLIDAEALEEKIENLITRFKALGRKQVAEDYNFVLTVLSTAPTIESKPVVHAHWIYETHKEPSNYFWNVTAECSNCCDEQNEIWRGCFQNCPDWLSRDTALICAKEVKLSNYCPNCGAQMDELVSKTDELNSSVKIPVISMEDVPKIMEEMEK